MARLAARASLSSRVDGARAGVQTAGMERIETTCAIAGGGPAGMMLGWLLARSGIRVTVLEKHPDFLRDFRGDTIHPATLRALDDLGELDAFLALPHHRSYHMSMDFGDRVLPVVDFAGLGERTAFMAMMPQWDFLDFLTGRATALPGFRLMMPATATGLMERDGRITGLRADTPRGPAEITADLVIAADGRGSTLRAAAGLVPQDLGAPIDVLWFRLSRQPDETVDSLARIAAGLLLVQLNRGDYWQVACVVPKGGADAFRAQGIDAFRARLAQALATDPARVAEIATWEDVKLLNVQVNRLPRWWRPGFLAIGDAAHAMSPIGGVGINMAIQDAVAAANLLAGPLRTGALNDTDLAAVQARRMMPVRMVQAVQVAAQARIIRPLLDAGARATPPLPMRLAARWPWLRRLAGRAVGLGPRPERPSAAIIAPLPKD